MIKKIAHIVLSVWLAILLLFGSTAKEFIHLFADHTDTVHTHIHEGDGLIIESEHHHCSFLGDSLPAFINDHQHVSIPYTALVYSSFYAIPGYRAVSISVPTGYLRGPPAMAVS